MERNSLYNFNATSGTHPDGSLLLVYPGSMMPVSASLTASSRVEEKSSQLAAADSKGMQNLRAQVFPNPSSHHFTMTLESVNPEIIRNTVTDLNGRILFSEEVPWGQPAA